MDIIKKAILFDGRAIVEVLDTSDVAAEARRIHGLSVAAARAMGRALTVAAFMSGNFKGARNRLTLIVEGGGEIGKMVLCGDYGARVRGYCENPRACAQEPDAPFKRIVGNKGMLSVIKDFGLKEPYNGLSPMISGDIAGDFAYYFTASEQLPSAIALGSDFSDDGKAVCGGVFIQPMPNCGEEYLVMLEDVASQLGDVAALLRASAPEQILRDFFGAFPMKILDDVVPVYACTCGEGRIGGALAALGEQSCADICAQEGAVELHCEFCGKTYRFDSEEIHQFFHGKDV